MWNGGEEHCQDDRYTRNLPKKWCSYVYKIAFWLLQIKQYTNTQKVSACLTVLH
jgi:hypothetical protein